MKYSQIPEKSQAENNACYSAVKTLSNRVLLLVMLVDFNRIHFWKYHIIKLTVVLELSGSFEKYDT